MLLGGIGAGPSADPGTPVSHADCCCGSEATCPCEPPRAPQGPRAPCGAQAQAQALPALPAATADAATRPAKREPRPWDGLRAAAPARTRASLPPALPRERPRPPDRSLQRLSELSTFRI